MSRPRPLSEVIPYCSANAGAWPLSAERKIEVSVEQKLKMYVFNGSDGRCIVAVRLIVGVRYLERPLREVLLYVIIYSENWSHCTDWGLTLL